MARRKVKIKIDGLDELMKELAKKVDGAQEILDNATDEASKLVMSKAKSLAPVDSGNLRQSLDTHEEKQKSKNKSVHQVATDDAFYGIFQEYGTKNHPAKPFMRPALQKSKSKIKKIIQEHIKKALGV